MSGEFHVRIQINPGSYKTLPMDGDMARELAEAMYVVREAVEAEQNERALYEAGKVHLTALEHALGHRRNMEDRALEMFRIILEGIPLYLAAGPAKPRAAGNRPRKSDVAW